MSLPTIQYPRGSGGNWLSNLIWHLENNQLTLPNQFPPSPCWFNQFINDAVKVRYHILNLSVQPIIDQFHILTDSAIYILTDTLWQKTWGQPGELDYRLLVEDSDQFINRLFSVLDNFDIKYTRNRSYCHSSIEYYKSTCPDPSKHLNNFNSLLWLAWCHAHVLINNQSLPVTIPSDATVDVIRSIVEPMSAEILATTLPMVAR